MGRRNRSGFTNDAADKIWNDHIGNNAFVRHRDGCPVCLEVYRTRDITQVGQPAAWCTEGDRIFHRVIEEVLAQIDEVDAHQN